MEDIMNNIQEKAREVAVTSCELVVEDNLGRMQDSVIKAFESNGEFHDNLINKILAKMRRRGMINSEDVKVKKNSGLGEEKDSN